MLWVKAESQKIAGELSIDIAGNAQQKARRTTVAVLSCSVILQPPWRPQQKKLPPIILTAILVWEENPPADVKEPIEWLLITNTPVADFHQAAQATEWYCRRWHWENALQALEEEKKNAVILGR